MGKTLTSLTFRATSGGTSTRLCVTQVKTPKGKWERDVSSAPNHLRPPLTHVFNCLEEKKKGKKRNKPSYE